MYRFSYISIWVVVLILLQACLLNNDKDDEPGEPFITGIITDIEPSGQQILVEENPDVTGTKENGGIKIWLSVDSDSALFLEKNGSLSDCEFSCFRINSLIHAWVSGAVAESYPLQGTAGKIVIIDE